MSQQAPFDNNSVPLGNDMTAANYVSPENYGQSQHSGGTGGGYHSSMPGPQGRDHRKISMIDPIESAKLTPQILMLLIFSGLRRHWKWAIPVGLILGLVAAGGLYLLNPIQYEASATVRIRSTIARILAEERQQSRYNEHVMSQIALIMSPVILDGALESSDVAKLPIILEQKNNRRDWLRKHLQVQSSRSGSEYLNISLKTRDSVSSEKIVNSVLDSYLAYLLNNSQEANRELMNDLQAERNRQAQSAKLLQESIRDLSKQAALKGAVAGASGLVEGIAGEESIKRDVLVTEATLTALRASRVASLERKEDPGNIPPSMLVLLDPGLADLSSKKEAIIAQRESAAQMLRSPETDPRIQHFDRQIKELDDKINAVTNDAPGGKKEEIYKLIQAQEDLALYDLDRRIREQEILANTLQQKYNDQLNTVAERTNDVLNVAFARAQLERTNKNLGTIDDRMLNTRADLNAPEQITALSRAVLGSPQWKMQIGIVGGGAAVCLCLPMLLGIVIERLKPRLYHVSQVRRSVPHVLIGEIMEPPVSWIHGTTFRKRLARYKESVHNWCTHLLLSDSFRSCRTLSIASVAGDDGKTFLAVQIATAMAQMKGGNVLLIDGDMKVGRLHLLFGNEEAGIGLADVLSFRNGFGEAMVQNEREPNLHLLSAGQLDVSPYELLGDGRFRELLDMLEQNYAMVLVVLPPISNAAESLIMASSTDSTLLCVRQGETVLAAMEDVYQKLINTGASVDGIVVKDIPYYQMAGKDGGFADKLEQIRLSHLLQYAE